MATIRQLAQRERRDREHQNFQSAVTEEINSSDIYNISQSSQRAHQIREARLKLRQSLSNIFPSDIMSFLPTNDESQGYHYNLTSQQMSIIYGPSTPQFVNGISFRHYLTRCNILCHFCKAEHWIEERIRHSSEISPKFMTCCMNGIVMMDKFDDPPQPLYWLLKDLTTGKIPISQRFIIDLSNFSGHRISSKYSKL